MTRLIVEAHSLQGPRRNRGIGRYVASLIEELHRQGHLAATLFNPELGPPIPDLRIPPAMWRPNTRSELRRLTRQGDVCYLVTSPFETGAGVMPALPPGVQDLTKVAAIVYDLIPFLFPEHYLADPTELGRQHAHLTALRECDLLLAISEATRNDVIRVLGLPADQVATIGSGLPEGFHPPAADALLPWLARRAVPGINRPYVLCVAAWEWRKNVVGLLEAWAGISDELRRRNNLVIVCHVPDHGRRGWKALADDLGIADSVVLAGELPDDQLRATYQAARLFVFPSRYEGFGFPPLESMASGVPTLVANNSSLIEIAAKEALFDVDRPSDIARAIERGLTDEDFRTRLKRAGQQSVDTHTWSRVAKRLEHAVDSLVAVPHGSDRRGGGRRQSPVQLAMIGPFSPSRTGVGVYNSRLVHSFRSNTRLDCFVDGDWRVADVGSGFAFPITAMGSARRACDYDAVIAVLGNSSFHVDTYECLQHTRGVAWFHDVNLTGLHRVRSERGATPNPPAHMSNALRACYGPHARRPPSLIDHDLIARDGFFMAAEAARWANATIVSSQLASTLLATDAGGTLGRPPIVLPLAFPEVDHSRERDDNERITVVSMGNLHEIKRPRVLIEALALLPPKRRPRLVFAGPDLLRDSMSLRHRIHELGLDDDVFITGWLSEHEYWEWMRVATVVVQLRETSYGESSATVAEAMAMGRVVVTSVAACADFPVGVHVQVPEDVTAEDLATVLTTYVTDRPSRIAIEDSAMDHARSWTFNHLADVLVDIAVGAT